MRTGYGKVLTLTYLVAWPTSLTGVICILATWQREPWAWIVWGCGVGPMVVCSEVLGFRDRFDDGWYYGRVRWFYRLGFGVELPNAWRTARHRTSARRMELHRPPPKVR